MQKAVGSEAGHCAGAMAIKQRAIFICLPMLQRVAYDIPSASLWRGQRVNPSISVILKPHLFGSCI